MLLVAFLFLQWWLLTHRYDRFWVPMLPAVAVLAGGGATWCDRAPWRAFLLLVVPIVLFFNLSYCVSSPCGYNQYAIRLVPHRHPYDYSLVWLEAYAPPSGRVLSVGDVAFFHYDGAIEYSTVFDDLWLIDRLDAAASSVEIGRELRQRNISLVLVNWSAIQRYRSPSGYGFSPHVTPARFRQLAADGVLRKIPYPTADEASTTIIDGEQTAPREAWEVVEK